MSMKSCWLGTLVVFLMICSVHRCYAELDPETLVGMWLFDDKRNPGKDSSGYENHGVLKNGAEWTKDGPFGGAMSFDGKDDYVDCGRAESCAGLDNFTVVVWYLQALDFDSGPLVCRGTGNGEWNFHAGITGPGRLFNEININGKFMGGASGVTGAKAGTWNHGAFTYDGKRRKMFMNGKLDWRGGDEPGKIRPTNEHVLIGAWSIRALEQWYNGKIDEVAIFNVALEEDDIQTIKEKGLNEALGRLAVSSIGRLVSTWGQLKTQ